jgi:hypothetical protein
MIVRLIIYIAMTTLEVDNATRYYITRRPSHNIVYYTVHSQSGYTKNNKYLKQNNSFLITLMCAIPSIFFKNAEIDLAKL